MAVRRPANSTAQAGADFTSRSGTLTFFPLVTTQVVQIPIVDDSLPEATENFRLVLSNPSGGATLTENFTATIDITDNDAPNGTVLISEFRARGPNGAADEFVELYNNSSYPLTVGATDGSTGWTVATLASDGANINPVFTIPNGTIIPPRGHFLGVNNQGYSLAEYPSGVNGLGTPGDASFVNELADNGGLALFKTTRHEHFTANFVLDAVGFADNEGAAASIFREGTGLTWPSAENAEFSFVRRNSAGRVRDTNDNAADFALVATGSGNFGRAGALKGMPGPESLASLLMDGNGQIGITELLLPTGEQPIGLPAGNGKLKQLRLFRRITNQTGQPLSHLRLRVVDMGGNYLDASVLSSSDVAVTLADGTSLNARGATLELSDRQAPGGGLNSSLNVPSVTPVTPLAAGQTITVNVWLQSALRGKVKLELVAEALP